MNTLSPKRLSRSEKETDHPQQAMGYQVFIYDSGELLKSKEKNKEEKRSVDKESAAIRNNH